MSEINDPVQPQLLVLKLNTGEEVTGLVTIDKDNFTIVNPIKIVSSPTPADAIESVFFIPYLINMEGNAVQFQRNCVLFYNPPSTEIKQMFMRFLKATAVQAKNSKDFSELVDKVDKETPNNPVEILLDKICENPALADYLALVLREWHQVLKDFKKEADELDKEADVAPEVEKPKKAKKKAIKKKMEPRTFDLPIKDEKDGNNPENWSNDIRDYL